jgi:hypothetical protein
MEVRQNKHLDSICLVNNVILVRFVGGPMSYLRYLCLFV